MMFSSSASGSFTLIFYFSRKGIIYFNIFIVFYFPSKWLQIACVIYPSRDNCLYFKLIISLQTSSPFSQSQSSLGSTYLFFNFCSILLMPFHEICMRQIINDIDLFQIFILSLDNSAFRMTSQIIGFSHNSVNISRQKPFILQINNKSKSQSMIFKIKTTKQNTYQVKPPLGSIQPGDKKNIQFKLVKPLTDDEFQQTRRDKFQLQFLLVSPNVIPKSKTQYKALWEQERNDPTKQGNFVNFTFPVQSQGQNFNRLKTAIEQPFSPIKPKGSLLRSEIKNATVRKPSNLQNDPKADQHMSKQFQKLKRQQSQLIEEREKIFKNQPKSTEKGSKSGVQIGLLVLAFLVSVMIGNFLKLRVFVQEGL